VLWSLGTSYAQVVRVMELSVFAAPTRMSASSTRLINATFDVVEALSSQRKNFVDLVAPSQRVAVAVAAVVRAGDAACHTLETQSTASDWHEDLHGAIRVAFKAINKATQSDWAKLSGLCDESVSNRRLCVGTTLVPRAPPPGRSSAGVSFSCGGCGQLTIVHLLLTALDACLPPVAETALLMYCELIVGGLACPWRAAK
jgi:hypothetical protein